ncbi:MAG: aminoacyl-tRNA hydrolase [Candidatus Anaerobiospirillum merdipullorum]|uniref:Peptidyl-tRNA hydrolase n=1 Tax=Candidatus Anaerobiospirillum merdipullorum TaxID=2838450 RepID=A0A9E2KLB5_9GAMM|nr:aminoacyl-tRNA hydrolase [Candidatus Anaerobiospirillum merdipullorum]
MAVSQIKLIVGLGNIGAKYQGTRHNCGCDLLFALADTYRISMNEEKRFFGILGRGNVAGCEVRLAFPTTLMNLSGQCVGALCTFYRIAPQEVLVLHDEMDLPPGSIRLKFGGGLAGHNGLKSIASSLGGQQDFYRLRIGIGKDAKRDTINFVLGRPAPAERALIAEAGAHALEGIALLMTKGPERAASFINSFKPSGFAEV